MKIEFISNKVTVKLGNIESYKYDSNTKELHITIDENESYFVGNVEFCKEIKED